MATIVTSTVTVSTGAGITTTTTTTSASPAAGEAAAATPPPPIPAVEFFLVGTDLDGAYKHTQVLSSFSLYTCPYSAAALYAALFYADV